MVKAINSKKCLFDLTTEKVFVTFEIPRDDGLVHRVSHDLKISKGIATKFRNWEIGRILEVVFVGDKVPAIKRQLVAIVLYCLVDKGKSRICMHVVGNVKDCLRTEHRTQDNCKYHHEPTARGTVEVCAA